MLRIDKNFQLSWTFFLIYLSFYINLIKKRQLIQLTRKNCLKWRTNKFFWMTLMYKGFIASIKNKDGVLGLPRFDFSANVLSEPVICIKENSEQFNMSYTCKVMDYQLFRTLAILLCHQNLRLSMEKTKSRLIYKSFVSECFRKDTCPV